MALGFMNYTNFDEYIAKTDIGNNGRTWLNLAGDLLDAGNILKYGEMEVTGFNSLRPRRHMVAWLFEDRSVKFGKNDQILLFREAQERLTSICSDPYQWTANGVPLPDVLNAFCGMVWQMDKGVIFHHSEGLCDYAGQQSYYDTLWYTDEYGIWSMIHIDGMYDDTPCSCDPQWCEFVSQCDEHEPYYEKIIHVKWRYLRVKKYLFTLHADHVLTKFAPTVFNEFKKSAAETVIRRKLKLPELKTAES